MTKRILKVLFARSGHLRRALIYDVKVALTEALYHEEIDEIVDLLADKNY